VSSRTWLFSTPDAVGLELDANGWVEIPGFVAIHAAAFPSTTSRLSTPPAVPATWSATKGPRPWKSSWRATSVAWLRLP